MQGWVTTGEASEHLKKTSVRDLFVCHMEPGKAVKRCRSSSRLPRYGHSKCHWRRCVELGARSKHQTFAKPRRWRHVSGRRLHAQLSLRDLLTMAFEFLSQEMLHFLVLLVSRKCDRGTTRRGSETKSTLFPFVTFTSRKPAGPDERMVSPSCETLILTYTLIYLHIYDTKHYFGIADFYWNHDSNRPISLYR